MVERQTRDQIDGQDVRERALLARMLSPGRLIVQAVIGVLVLVVVLAAVRALS